MFLAQKNMQQTPMINGVPAGAYGVQWQQSSGLGYNPMENPEARQWMDYMRTFDPTARWEEIQDSSGNSSWGFRQDDVTKQPMGDPQVAETLRQYGGGMTLEPVFRNDTGTSHYNPGEQSHSTPVPLRDPSMVIKTPYAGRTTLEANLKHPRDYMSTIAPMIIMALATFGAGGAISPLISGAMNGITGLGRGGGLSPGMLMNLGRYFMGGGAGG